MTVDFSIGNCGIDLPQSSRNTFCWTFHKWMHFPVCIKYNRKLWPERGRFWAGTQSYALFESSGWYTWIHMYKNVYMVYIGQHLMSEIKKTMERCWRWEVERGKRVLCNHRSTQWGSVLIPAINKLQHGQKREEEMRRTVEASFSKLPL